MRIIPSLIGAALAACLLLCSTFPALSQKSKSAVPEWDPSKIDRHAPLGSQAASQALSYRGVPYHFGGQSRKGVDCSGLIQSAFKQWGILLPRTSVEQYQKGKTVPKTQIVPGDLVFFKNTYKRGVSHVGIYVGYNQFVHASSARGQVTVSSLSDSYYTNHWAGARRIALDKPPNYVDDDSGDVLPDAHLLTEKAVKKPGQFKVVPAGETPPLETDTASTRGKGM